MEFAHLAARAVDKFGIDPDNINVTSTDIYYAMRARRYCYVGHDPPCPMEWATIKYRPSMAGNVIYLLCFIALLGGQLFFGIRKKTWTYLGTICAGILGEIVGYIGRILLNRNPWSMDLFLTNLVSLTISPALFTAGIYLCLSRVIVAVGADNSRLKPKMYTYVFIGADLLALVLQAIGGGMASTAKDSDGSQQGVNIMIAGLVSQVVSMALFFAVWGDFVLRTRRAKKSGMLNHTQPPLYGYLRSTKDFKLFQWSLFVATVLIFIRCVYRVAELWEGFSGHLANDEATFMIFEGPMIILALIGMTIFHPGRIFDDLWVSAGKGLEGKLTSASSVELTAESAWGSHGNTAYERV